MGDTFAGAARRRETASDTDRCSRPAQDQAPWGTASAVVAAADIWPRQPAEAGRETQIAAAGCRRPCRDAGPAGVAAAVVACTAPVEKAPVPRMPSAEKDSSRWGLPADSFPPWDRDRCNHGSPAAGLAAALGEAAGDAGPGRPSTTWSGSCPGPSCPGTRSTRSWSGIGRAEEQRRRCWRRRHLAGGCSLRGSRVGAAEPLEDHRDNPTL